MSNDGYVQVPADSVGKKVDASSLTVGADIVVRQRVVISDTSNPNAMATVNSANALVVAGNITVDAVSATVTVQGNISISGNVNVTVTSPITIAGGTAAIGAVSLGAGSSNIGFLDSISKTVQVQVASRIGIDNISASVNTVVTGIVEKASGNPVQVADSANSAVRVNIVAGSAAGVSQVDDTSFTAAAAAFVPMGGYYVNGGTGVSLSVSHAGAFRMTQFRAQHVNLRTDGDVKMEDSANSALRVNIVAGSAAGVSQVDDTSYSNAAAVFVPVGGVYEADGGAFSLSASHAGAVRMSLYRAMHVTLRTGNGSQVDSASPLSVKVENLSATASVVLAAGSANIGTVDGISKTVNVVVGAGTQNIGAVSLAAGTSNIGLIDSISKTLNTVLAAGTNNIGLIDNISKTINVVLAAGAANIGTVNGISQTVNVVLMAGANNVGSINNISRTVVVATAAGGFTVDNVSATLTVTTSNPWVVASPSVSHGPVCVQFSTSATATFITAPGAGNFLYITMLAATNAGSVNSTFHAGPSASTSEIQMYMVSAGGGFVLYFDPPIRCPVNEAFFGFTKPNTAGDVKLNLNFFVRNA